MFDLTSFFYLNPWREGKEFDTASFLPREVLPEILKWIDDPDILIVTGPRQSGKTVILKLLIKKLLAKGVSPKDIFYFNLDKESLLTFFENSTTFLEWIENQKTKRAYVFVDEVQRVQKAGLFFKFLYDLNKNIKFIFSGSSSLKIGQSFDESLTGRKKVFYVLPLRFSEAVSWYLLEHKLEEMRLKAGSFKELEEIKEIYGKTLQKLWQEFVVFGGYPRVVLEKNREKKIFQLSEIYDSYIKRDVKDFLNVENISGFNKLVGLLALQIGNLVSISELSNSSRLARETVEKYLTVLEETYIIELLLPFFTNPRKELIKSPKIFYIDPGLRNAVISSFASLDKRVEKGAMFENAVFTEFFKKIKDFSNLHFWRTQTKAEVDFILTVSGEKIPIEVKFQPKRLGISSSLRSFLTSYPTNDAYILTNEFLAETKILSINCHFLPAYLAFLEKKPFFLKSFKTL